MQKFLALGEMPQDAKPKDYLAAGPWCFCGREQLFPGWEKDFSFAPEPLSDPAKLPAAAKQAQALCLRIMPELAATLCDDPGKFPATYWQIIFLPWAIALSSQIVERWSRIKAMIAVWGNENLTVELLPPEISFNFKNERDFYLRGGLGTAFNHWIFSRLLEIDFPANWKKIVLWHTSAKLSGNAVKPGKRTYFLNMMRNLALRLPFPPLKGISVAQALLFSVALLHRCKKLPPKRSLASIFPMENFLSSLPDISYLMPIFKAALPASIRKLRHPAIGEPTKKDFLKIASILSYEDASYRQKLARWKAADGRLAYAQHGGNYGQIKVSCNAAMVEYSQDIFFTWGWKKHGHEYGNFKPMPYPQLATIADAWRRQNDNIIFVGTEMACYAYRLESRPTPLQFLQYRRDKALFLKACAPEIRKDIFYRPYFNIPGLLLDGTWIASRFAEIKICEGNLAKRLLGCKMLILDHPGTTMLEALAANVPAILYWNPNHWPMTAEAAKLLNELKEAGIWHETPQEAAKKLNEIAHNPKSWWFAEAVQKARRNYCYNQARTEKSGTTFYWLSTLWQL